MFRGAHFFGDTVYILILFQEDDYYFRPQLSSDRVQPVILTLCDVHRQLYPLDSAQHVPLRWMQAADDYTSHPAAAADWPLDNSTYTNRYYAVPLVHRATNMWN